MSEHNVVAYVFPGQGSQKIGMGKSWADQYPVAREIFELADDVLGFGLSRLCWEGPNDELALTANLQPALLTTSIATLRAAESAGLPPAVAVAGHSLGEYSALVAAGILEFSDALRLVRERGRLMQEAVPVGEGAMAAILALDDDAVRSIVADCAGSDVLALANLNAPGQVVVAGTTAAVERAAETARERGGKSKMLPVSAPFHCPLMASVREGLEPMLRSTSFSEGRVPVVNNVDAQASTDGETARDALVRQIDSSVRWVESVERMVDDLGVGTFVEVGPGKVLAGTIRRIRSEPLRVALSEPTGLETLTQQ